MPKDYEGAELARAYGFLASADRWLGRVRATQNYTFWKYAGDNMIGWRRGIARRQEERLDPVRPAELLVETRPFEGHPEHP